MSISNAALIVSYGPQLNLVQGQTGTLDVLIRSSDGSDDLSLFSAKFMIAPVAGTGLEFLDPPNDSQYLDPNYIFAGTNIDGLPSVVGPADTIVTSDGTVGPDGFVTVPTENRLLVTLDISAMNASANSQFQISLIDDDVTDFLDDGFNPLSIDSESFTNVGVVNVSAVPEPSSVAALGLGAMGIVGARYRRRQRKQG